MSGTNEVVLRAISRVFRWWAERPWIVFWATLLVVNVIFIALKPPSDFVLRIILPPYFIVLILSFFRGIYVTCKRSKFVALKGLLVIVGLVMAISAMAIPRVNVHRKARYVNEVKADLKNAAAAQKSYFAKSQSYKPCAPCTASDLPGYEENPDVTLVAKIERMELVLVGTHKGCGDGQWIYKGSTGEISGPRFYDVCK